MCCRASGLLADKGMICFHMCGPRGEGGNFSFRFQLLDLKQVFGSAGVELVLSDTKLMWREGDLPQTVKSSLLHILHCSCNYRLFSLLINLQIIVPIFKNANHNFPEPKVMC